MWKLWKSSGCLLRRRRQSFCGCCALARTIWRSGIRALCQRFCHRTPECSFPNTTKPSFLSVFLAHRQQNWQNLRAKGHFGHDLSKPTCKRGFVWMKRFVFFNILTSPWPFLGLSCDLRVRWNCPQN